MAIAHRATSSATATIGTETSIAPAVPTGTTDGDLLLAWVSQAADSGGITPPAGWTQLAQYTGQGNRIYLGYKIANGESGSYSFSFSASRATAIISAYSGVDNTNPIFVYSTDNTTGTGTATAPALSKFGTDPTTSWLVTFFSINRGQITTTAPTGYTIPTNGNPDSTSTFSTGVESGVAYMTGGYSGGSGIQSAAWGTAGAAPTCTHIALRTAGDTQTTIFGWPGAGTFGTTNSLALAMPANHEAGDLLLAIAVWDGSSITASMSGWTQKGSTVDDGAGPPHHLAYFYKYAASSSESGTLALSSSTDVAVSVQLIKRAGTSGDPFGDYQGTNDTSSDSTSSFAALTVAAQEMLLYAANGRSGNGQTTAAPTGYNGATTDGQTLFIRNGSLSGNVQIGVAISYTTSANPAGGTFTNNGSSVSVGGHGAITVGSAGGGGTDVRRMFYASVIG